MSTNDPLLPNSIKNKIMKDLAKDNLKILVEKILEVQPTYFDNPNGGYEFTCPFCGSYIVTKGLWESEPGTMENIKHDEGCAYIFAKDIYEKILPEIR